MDYRMLAGQSPPNSASTTASRRGKFFLPLSNHGMPKTPLPTSPGTSIRSHRFGSLRSPRSPLSPGRDSLNSPLLSPPLSAKSCNTFIESEPSTPAYSPRPHSTAWDGATLVFLSPQPTPSLSQGSIPSLSSPAPEPMTPSPVEPEWEMMAPPPRKDSVASKMSTKANTTTTKATTTNKKEVQGPVSVFRERSFSVDDSRTATISRNTSLSSHPPTPLLPKTREQDKSQIQRDTGKGKENIPPEEESNTTVNDTGNSNEDGNALLMAGEEQGQGANHSSLDKSLDKLASKMKSMLRRKTVGEKKTELARRSREREELLRMETVHWTEM